MRYLLIFSFLFVTLFSCHNNNSNADAYALLPAATGGADELLVVMHDAYMNEEINAEVKKNFIEAYKILPQSQARFVISSVAFSKMNTILKRFINPIYIITKNEKSAIATEIYKALSEEEKQQIADGSKSIFFKSDIWARNQNIAILIAPNKNELISTLKNHKDEINAFYDETNLVNYKKLAYIDGINKSLNKQLNEYHNFSLDIPLGYQLAKNEKNYILLRKDDAKTTLFISIDVDYYNAEIPINNLGIEKFDSLGEKIDGEAENSYVVADTTLGFVKRKIEKNGLVIFENAGLWVMENDFVGGGPFVNNYIIDNKNKRVIYLSGLMYGPAEKNKKKFMRQFEAIFSTLELN